jgi:hypothetical protein
MALPAGVSVLLLFHAILFVLVALAVAVAGWLLAPPAWVTSPDAPERWLREARTMASDVQRLVDDGATLPDDRVRRRLLPLSGRLDRHAELAPAAVDDDLVVGVTRLAIGCRVVGTELTRAQRLDWDAPDGEVAAVAAVAEDLSRALATDGDTAAT